MIKLKAIVSVFFAAIFLAANLQLHIGTHYCGGEAVMSEIVFGHPELTCGMTKEGNSCEQEINYHSNTLTKKECCQTEFSAIQIEEEFNTKIKLEKLIQKSFDLANNLFSLLHSFSSTTYSFKPDRPPPLISQDLQVLFQTFLI